MCALCAARVSLVSLGMANESIWSLSEPSLVRCRTVTLVIFWPARVSWTCIGPYWVFATVPVTVRAAAEVGAAGLLLVAGRVVAAGVGADAPTAWGVAGAASAVAPTWVLNDRSAASPAVVPPRTSTA